jgi:transposase
VPPRQSQAALDRLHPHAAGIDCGSAEHFVAVPPDRDPTPVQCFPTFTADLHRLADWLTACRVTHVAMEATGVYWIPIFEILDARGFEVILVNARHVKNLPGRKSDVSDCEWLRDLHILGLLRGSFRPADGIVALRGYLRHRATLIESAGAIVQRMQKALVQMNVQLHWWSATSPGSRACESSATSWSASATRSSSPAIETTGVTRPRPRSSPP